MRHDDTIFALASAPGKSGVAVVRISGSQARQAAAFLGVTAPLPPRVATLVTLTHRGTVIDRPLALAFQAPHSFTGEDVVELHLHGGRAILRQTLAALSAYPGLRMAEPGEFTRRAFMHGKMDLLQAESLADLIDADTPAQHAHAMRQLDGASARVNALREAVLLPLALLEAYIDFPDEEIPEETLQEVSHSISHLRDTLRALLSDGGMGEKLREGITIVIVGPPNAGKSSLLNLLAQRDAAIVSPEAGTTRDVIEVHMEIGGYAVLLIDTAGVREAANMIEAEGVRRALERAAHADIKLAVFDSVSLAESYSQFQTFLDKNTIIIANKSDLATPPAELGGCPVLALSVASGAGVPQLLARIHAAIEALVSQAPSPLITRARHRQAFAVALAALERFATDAPLEIMCEELRIAAAEIGKITGKIHVDDVLDVVFRRFCIGK